MRKIVFASNNEGKIIEAQQAMQELDYELIPQNKFSIPEAEETGLTFIENAILKARHASTLLQMPALADDSGIVVDALRGAPGIYSARFSGEHASSNENNKKLLQELAHVTKPVLRRAHFYCAMVFLQHAKDPMPLIGVGRWEGQIAFSARGEQGHGYDPIFYLPDLQCTAAQLSLLEKNKLSHRGKALRALLEKL